MCVEGLQVTFFIATIAIFDIPKYKWQKMAAFFKSHPQGMVPPTFPSQLLLMN